MSSSVETSTIPIDLHMHTNHSDGDETPAALMESCVSAGLSVIALTDHDTVGGISAFQQAAQGRLTVIPGCELTGKWNGIEIHCLGYYIDPDDHWFETKISEVRNAELDCWRAWTEKARSIGVPLEWATVEDRIGRNRVGYFGDYLAMLLDAAHGDRRFSKYEGPSDRRIVADWCEIGRPLYVEPPILPDVRDLFEWIAASGGVSVLAHPGQILKSLGIDEFSAGVRQLKDDGLVGLEAWTSWHAPSVSLDLSKVCKGLDLIATAGSDYHGQRVKPWVPGPGRLRAVPDDALSIVDQLFHRLPASQ